MLNKLFDKLHMISIIVGTICLFTGKVEEAQVMFLCAILMKMEIKSG